MSTSSQHLDSQQLRAWARRELSPREQLELSDHLAQCAECQQRLSEETLAPPQPRARREFSVSTPQHLTDDEIAAYVRDLTSVANPARIEAHMQKCAPCRQQIESLRQLEDQMTGYLGRNYEPAPRATWLGSIAEALKTWLQPVRLLAVSGAAALLLVFVLARHALLDNRRPFSHTSDTASNDHSSNATPAPATPSSFPVLPFESPKIAGSSTPSSIKPEVAPPTPGLFAGIGTPPPTILHGDIPSSPATTLHQITPPDKGKTSGPMSGWLLSQTLRDGAHTIQWDAQGNLQSGLEGIDPPWIDWVRATVSTGIIVRPASPAETAHNVDSLRDPAAIAQVRRAEQNASSHSGSHLVLGVVYARFGLKDMAEKEFRALAEENPSSPLAAGFLRQITEK